MFPSNYTELLKKAARFVVDIIYPNYTIDNFNDTRSVSWTKNVLLKNFKKYMEMFPDDKEIQWMATEGKQGTKPTELVQIYDASGYYMLRSGWESNATMMILKNNNNPETNGTAKLIMEHSGFTGTVGISARMQGYTHTEEHLPAMPIVQHLQQQRCIIQ